MNRNAQDAPVRESIEVAVYLLLVLGLLAWCLLIVTPFVSFILWGAVIAVSVYGPFLKLSAVLGNRRKLAVAVFLVAGLAMVIVPAWLFAGSLFDSAQSFRAGLHGDGITIPRANESVKDWPVVGEKLYSNWSAAAANFEGWLNEHRDQLRGVVSTALGRISGIALAVLQFVGATLVAGLMLASAESSRGFLSRLSRRLAGEQGDELLTLTTATVRSVTVGVLGIAFIQALLGGIGMVAVGVPGAGLLALIILVLAIAQLPPWLVLFPVIFYVFSTHDSNVVATLFAVWSVIVSFLDMVLKPLMLGRGVKAPMPVILLGAIGGLIHSGIIGLFVGAVVLALGFRLFMAWLQAGEPATDPAGGG